MEALFKRHFWIFHVVMVAILAFLLAKGANGITGHYLEGAVITDAAGKKSSRKTKKPKRRFDLANEKNIFDGLRDIILPLDGGEIKKDEDDAGVVVNGTDWENAVLSELRAKVVGTVVFEDYTLSLASIIDESEGRKAAARLYSVNECDEPIPEAGEDAGISASVLLPTPTPCKTLLEINDVWHVGIERVYVFNKEENRLEFLLVDQPKDKKKKGRKKKKRKKKKDKDKKDDFGEGITKIGPNSYEITQNEVDKALGNLSKLTTMARVVPAFEGGETIGFKLFSIRPGSLYSKIGIRNGDIIQRVNGYDINSPDKALEVYQKLKSSKSVSVDIKRRGKPVTIDYGISQ
ncbi:MAG: hypothetical protein GY822_18925 [Deltaproteobacteria bacterium]|nr:hypothetical protein [Deltaproteobacteria bacterium]